MLHPYRIHRIAILGAGVMGAQIAAHCVNAGFKVLLFDLSQPEAPNQIAAKAINHLLTLKPAPLAGPEFTHAITPCNYDEHLELLSECELIIEAIAERMDWKVSLFKKISPFVSENTLIASNTSGLSINALSDCLPINQQRSFCGVHFFNPPRYMSLVELIPAKSTSNAVVNFLESFLTRYLGKEVVRAYDTPNFIANRIGVFSLLAALHHAEQYDLNPDSVDALTGPLIGRPKSATYRTMDVVGLDTMVHVLNTMQSELKDDPWHAYFKLPHWLSQLIEKGYLGQKAGGGVYRKDKKAITVYDPKQGTWRAVNSTVSEEVISIFKLPTLAQQFQGLFTSKHREAQYLAAVFKDIFHYSAYHLETISDCVDNVDRAMRAGFGWERGPFETWQQGGFEFILTHLKEQPSLPDWVKNVQEFYQEDKSYSPRQSHFVSSHSLPVYKRQYRVTDYKVLYEDNGVILKALNDEITFLQFKSKFNTLGSQVLEGLNKALDCAEADFQGLIIYQSSPKAFSYGANLKEINDLLLSQSYTAIEALVIQFQKVLRRLKYCSIPVVAAVRGLALGGGCELMLHCDAVVSSFESYPGLVEVGVGLLPAGGGCKEMAIKAARSSDPTKTLKRYFEQIAMCEVAANAWDAQRRGYLSPCDHWLMHPEEVLQGAIRKIETMNSLNYLPQRESPFKVLGREGHAFLKAGLINWLEGGFISAHEFKIADKLAGVLCGGDVYEETLVDEEWLFRLEREAFMELIQTPETEARIKHMLETGKPLRN